MHYENVKTDVLGEMRKILNFFNMPINEERLKCLFKHKGGFQLLDLIITELKSHMTCYNPMLFIG